MNDKTPKWHNLSGGQNIKAVINDYISDSQPACSKSRNEKNQGKMLLQIQTSYEVWSDLIHFSLWDPLHKTISDLLY